MSRLDTRAFSRQLLAAVAPTLRLASFERLATTIPTLPGPLRPKGDERGTSLRWGDGTIFCVRIARVGNSSGAGWPPWSLTVGVGVEYTFLADSYPWPRDTADHLLFPFNACRIKHRLTPSLNQDPLTSPLSAPERARRDRWWLDENGPDPRLVIDDVVRALGNEGVALIRKHADLMAEYSHWRTMLPPDGPEVDRKIKASSVAGTVQWLTWCERFARKVNAIDDARHYRQSIARLSHGGSAT